MKLTWFAGATIRIQIGGRILVADPVALPGVDPDELVSGSDGTFWLEEAGVAVDPAIWQPRRVGAMIEGEALPEVLVHGIAGGALVAAAGEPPVVLLKAELPAAGRWMRDAVVVVFGDDAAALSASVLEQHAPRLIAVAASDLAVEQTFAALRERLNGTMLVALEAGMALEV